LIKAADQLGWSQEKLNRFVQANAMDIFQIEAKKRNLSWTAPFFVDGLSV
jgi:broad-specificity NMP kinase